MNFQVAEDINICSFSLVITKMLIKAWRWYFLLISLVKIKKINNISSWQTQVEKRALTDTAGENGNSILYTAFLEVILAVLIKNLHDSE